AEALSANLCLRQSIQSFAAAGGRVYAEGAGLAYLCRQVILQGGSRLPMVNALPAVALRSPSPEPVRPATVRLKRATWLGSAYQELRRYLNTSWRIRPWASLTSLALEAERQDELFGLRDVGGSRMHFHFAAQPEFLRAFFRRHHVAYAAV